MPVIREVMKRFAAGDMGSCEASSVSMEEGVLYSYALPIARWVTMPDRRPALMMMDYGTLQWFEGSKPFKAESATTRSHVALLGRHIDVAEVREIIYMPIVPVGPLQHDARVVAALRRVVDYHYAVMQGSKGNERRVFWMKLMASHQQVLDRYVELTGGGDDKTASV